MKISKSPTYFSDEDYNNHPAIPPSGNALRGYILLSEANFQLIDMDADHWKQSGDTLVMLVPEKLEGYLLAAALEGFALLKPDEMHFVELEDGRRVCRFWWD
jgi:hypothetical protein